MKLISVVTVVFNDVENIGCTIESVLSQNIPQSEFEYIVIDGGSTDGTVDVIKRYIDKISIFISEKDSGIYNAMNKSLQYITGKWCIFLNSGDCLCKNAFRILDVDPLIGTDVGIIFGNTIRSFKQGRMRYRVIFKQGEMPPVCHQSAFIRSDIMKRLGYNEHYRICADLDLFKKIFDYKYRFYYVNQDVAIYDMVGFSAQNMVTYAKEKKAIGFNMSVIELIKFYLKSCLFKLAPTLYNYLLYKSIKRKTRLEDILTDETRYKQ